MKARHVLFGDPVAHSRSPQIYAAFGLPFGLVEVAADDFADAVTAFARDGGAGANCTLPHKAAALALADSASARARRAGAANLLRFDADGAIFADNTDGVGLIVDLTQNLGLELAGKRLLVIGTSGAAAGTLGPLQDSNPAALVLCGRDFEKAQRLAARFADTGAIETRPLDNPGEQFDFVFNATSASLTGDVPQIPPSSCVDAIAYDYCYSDGGETAFTRWARESGAITAADGWGMLVEQAAESCLIWTGYRPDTSALLRNRDSGVNSAQ